MPAPATAAKPRHVLLRGSLVQRLRLGAGLVLLLFAATHFLNHALGLVGIEAMEAMQTARYAVTRSVPGTIVLGAAVLIHIALALYKIAGLRSWRLPLWEAFQIASGVAIPLLLIHHAVGMRGSATLYGTSDFYRPSLAVMWPGEALRQSLLLVVVWAHGCIGLHYWLRLASWYGRLAPWLLGLAVLLPAAALAGFMAGGREMATAAASAGARQELLAIYNWPDVAGLASLQRIEAWLTATFVAALGAALAVSGAHRLREGLRPQVSVTYTAGPMVTGALGATLLEISRACGVPHASICGGRARCSTCRVRIEAGSDSLPEPGFAEAVTLGAIHAPPNVRLACQVRPTSAVTLTRLVAPETGFARVPGAMEADAEGAERQLAVMFLDLKGFTALSERRLPYDVVFLLNRFFRTIGVEIVSEGGWIDKYMGDGLLAVFGREAGLAAGARAALAAAARIDDALDRLNAELADEGVAGIGVGMGIHAGPMVVGRVGYAAAAQVTVIGATVNLASRLESLTRAKGCQLIVSRALADAAGWRGDGFAREAVVVRGTEDSVNVLIIHRARDVMLGS